ncbi:prepilin-type N-terminal cleavage/methylation domain-containing protein [Candidatus Peribacteria bacterium]|nr:MAG: prepilin-type N-terminal cleavage/methylation domain-containing protein [Candidatus Peribacteria bacterium]
MKRAGFTIVEMLMVIGIIGVISGVTVPLYRDYQVRNDLNVATEQVTQGLARARLLSQSAQSDAGWGFYVPAGILYKGDSYATRVAGADETYPMPSTITVTGIFDISYTKVKGQPSSTGSIILTALDSEQRTIEIEVQKETIAVVEGDNLTICHKIGGSAEQTKVIPDAAWPGHQNHGDTLGACATAASSVSSSRSSSRSSSSVSSSRSSSAPSSLSSSVASATCADRFSVSADNTITTTGPLSVIFQSLGAQFGYGNGGPTVPVTVKYSKKANGNSASNLFSGNAINGTGGATQTVTGFKNGDKVVLKFRAYYNDNGWLTYDNTVVSNVNNGSVKVLRNGDLAPTIPGSSGQQSVSSLLQPITVNGRISIGQYDVVMIVDFNYADCPTCTSADFQDGIVLVKFQAPSC